MMMVMTMMEVDVHLKITLSKPARFVKSAAVNFWKRIWSTSLAFPTIFGYTMMYAASIAHRILACPDGLSNRNSCYQTGRVSRRESRAGS
jgi:hypothetical protein